MPYSAMTGCNQLTKLVADIVLRTFDLADGFAHHRFRIGVLKLSDQIVDVCGNQTFDTAANPNYAPRMSNNRVAVAQSYEIA